MRTSKCLGVDEYKFKMTVQQFAYYSQKKEIQTEQRGRGCWRFETHLGR